LLGEYTTQQSETAFAQLVSRYVDLVYSVALRGGRDRQLAEDDTQTVFLIFARKARSLNRKTGIPGWLCQTARFTAARASTMQQRRQLREHEAYMQSALQETSEAANMWHEIEPHLELQWRSSEQRTTMPFSLGSLLAAVSMMWLRPSERLHAILYRNPSSNHKKRN